MKVIIFTYKHSNYGAVLQCYALYHYIKSRLNADVEVLDYTTLNHINSDAIFKKRSKNIIKQICYLTISLIRFLPLVKRRKRNAEFKHGNIKFTALFTTKEELLNNLPFADIYITGSDQVFNIDSENFDVYYLNFNKGRSKKLAYAPSFGTSSFNEGIKRKILPLLKDFDALSCREKDGAAFISSIIGNSIPTVVDPTLLLKPDEWLRVAVFPKFRRKYILIYDLNGGERLVKIAKVIQKTTDLPIVCITNKIEKFYSVDKQIYSAGPGEFLGWFAKADYIVTDSFHGTVFSIQFNKPFNTYIAVKQSASRITSLLESLNLSDRIVYDDTIGNFKFPDSNYIVNESLLKTFRDSSETFLKKNCKITTVK